MAIRVGINGFGRIGRSFVRAARGRADIEVVAVNDLTSPAVNAQLLRFDSTQGRFPGTVEATESGLVVDGRAIAVTAEKEPKAIDWGAHGVQVVLEATGRFTKRADAAAHLESGPKRVIICAPSEGADATFVIGVNDHTFDPARHVVVSNASCTTNCFAPMAKVLDDAFTIAYGFMSTVHAYTNDQSILDLQGKDPRRSRAAALNIVPTSTGAAKAIGEVLPHLAGRLSGTALRVPVPVGSITDFTAVTKETTAEQVNAAFRAAAAGPLAHILRYSEDPLVSSDIVGLPFSCVFDAPLTAVQPAGPGQSMVKVLGWYDNEWGYSNRLVDLVALIGGAG